MARRAELEAEAAMQLEQPAQPEQNSHHSQSLTGNSMAAVAKEVRKGRTGGPAGGAKHRPPVTTIPAKYQSTGRLRQAIQQLTEAAVAEELDDDDPELNYVEVLPTVLEVLVQARIVPLESFVDVYGRPALEKDFYPSLMVHSTRCTDIDALLPFTAQETQLVRDVLDGLLAGVVHDKRIAEAYTDVSEDPVPYFCQMTAEMLAKTFDTPETNEEEETELSGEQQCLIEEVLEELLYQIVAEAQLDNGVLSNPLPTKSIGRNGRTGNGKEVVVRG